MEKLYNGITLPDVWPPVYPEDVLKKKQPTPYLENPPEVIDITVGRQLFVDDFLIEETNLHRVCHKAKKYEGNPVLKPESHEEREVTIPCAAPKSGGVWWDGKEKKFKMWYEAGWLNGFAYAESADGIHWQRPELDVIPGTNRLLPFDGHRDPGQYWGPEYFRTDSTTVWIDDEDDPTRRYKLFMRAPGGAMPGILMTSSDGIHWENITETAGLFDRSTFFYNPFRKKWVCSIRRGWPVRKREYYEADEFLRMGDFDGKSIPWLMCDETDKPDDLIRWDPQLYNVDAVGYESVMLGMFQIMYGPENDVGQKTGCPKITELIPMFSRDGFHFTRPTNESIIDASRIRGTWDRGYVQSVGGICIVRKDELWIYYIGFAGDTGHPRMLKDDWTRDGMYSGGATGIAVLRRDGFCSMEGQGTLTTRKLCCSGKNRLFANFSGSVSAEVLDEDGKCLAVSEAVFGDETKKELHFADIPELEGKSFRLRFNVEGALYAFWLAKDERGISDGPLAAGAPDDEA